MSNCFNFDLCDEFTVHIYDFDSSARDSAGFEPVEPSDIYSKVLKSIKESRFYTNDPKRACLKILGKIFTWSNTWCLPRDLIHVWFHVHYNWSIIVTVRYTWIYTVHKTSLTLTLCENNEKRLTQSIGTLYLRPDMWQIWTNGFTLYQNGMEEKIS